MREILKQVYDQIEMPETCGENIRRAMEKKERKRTGRALGRLVTAASAAVLVLLLTPSVRAAVDGWMEEVFYSGTGLSVLSTWDRYGRGRVEVHYDTESPNFVQLREGRLYFTRHGQELDITDELTEDEPLIFVSEDKENNAEVYMVVGYHGSLENFGTYVFIWDNGDTPTSDGYWETGAGRNFLDPETGKAYPWVRDLWETLMIPWPMPGEESGSYEITAETSPEGILERAEIEKKK